MHKALLTFTFTATLTVLSAQKTSITFSSVIESLNQSIEKQNDSIGRKMRGISLRDDGSEEIPKFNAQYKGSFDRFAKEDISHIATGNDNTDLFNNNCSLDILEPTLRLGLSYWLGRTEPNYKTIYNKANCEMMEVERKKFPEMPFRLAASVEMTAGTANNISTLFSSAGKTVNSDLRIKPALTFVFQGKYRLENADCFNRLKSNIADEQNRINDAVALSGYLQRKIKKQMDSLDVAYEKNMTRANIPRDADLARDIKAEKRKLNIQLAEEEYVETDLRSELTQNIDDIIYNFPYKHKTYFWFSLGGDWAWHNYARYNAGDSTTLAYVDNVQFMTYNFGPSLNLMHDGMPNSWLTRFFLCTKLWLGKSNNTMYSSSNSYTTYEEEQIDDSTVTYNTITTEAYEAADFKQYWVLNWNTNFIWYVDPMKIFGVNLYCDFNTNISGGPMKGFWTLGQGLVFAIPSIKDSERSITNFTLFFEQVDVRKSSITTTEGATTKQRWFDRLDIGLKIGVPFGIFGRR